MTRAPSFFDDHVAAIAHRGGFVDDVDEGRENTLYAFSRAVELGYRYLETDVHTTRDGVLVAFHDTATDRLTGNSGRICEMDFAQLRELRIGGIDPVPTLEEVLVAFPDIRLNVDLKAIGAVSPLVDALARHNAWHRVLVTSFNPGRLLRFRLLARGRCATGISRLGVAWNAYGKVLPQWVNSPGEALQIPISFPIAGREIRVLTDQLFRNARLAGKRIHVWTINDPAQMHALLDAGVDGLVSDRIDVLKQVLVERGQWV